MTRTLKEVERDIERKRGILNKAGETLRPSFPLCSEKITRT
ncbi:Uncharacterised protein [Actinobacillus pleuropneumoniae]|nr:Uncharacterised protein [Actinobacillus pleuropneumoniae]